MCKTAFGFVLVTALLLLGAVPARAAETYKIDPAHTNLVFVIDHQGYSKMIGHFRDFDGTILFDKDDVAKSSVSIAIKTASVDTHYEDRDADLRSSNFFNAVEFPEMTFKSTTIEKTGDNTAKITGDFTLLGVTEPLTLEVTFNREGPDEFSDDYKAGFSARGSLKRSDFGMTYAIPAIGDEVELMIEVEAIRQ